MCEYILFERMWSFLILWVFCVSVSQENFWVYGFAIDWVSYCVYGFVSWIFFFLFSGFDGDWVWLLDLDLGFARDWFGCFLDLGRT